MTNREVISQVRGTHKLFADAIINDRVILAEVRTSAHTLINQKTNQRKLWNTDTLFTPIDCLEMETVSLGECCGYSSDMKVSRSKLTIPSIVEGNYQYLIQGVYNVGVESSYKYTPLSRFLNLLKLGLQTNDTYYWIHGNRLYVSSPYAEVVKLVASFEGDVPYDLLYPECDCAGSKKNPCISRLDEQFKCPSILIGPVITLTSQRLLSSYFKIPVDHTSNNKDDQTNIK